jgi:hypothetical protein
MKYTECSNEWLRKVICGEITFRKCPTCDKNGVEYQCYNSNGDTCRPDDETAERSVCEKCDGIAYIATPS